MVRQKLAGPLDLVGQRNVGQRFGMDQVINNPSLGRGLFGRQLALERPGQRERLGAARGVGIGARNASIVARGGAGSSIAASERASACTAFQRSSWRTCSRAASTCRIAGASCGVWSLSCPRRVSRSVGAVPLATWTPAALTCHSAFFSRACLARAGQNVGNDGCRSSSSDQCRATAGAALPLVRSNVDARLKASRSNPARAASARQAAATPRTIQRTAPAVCQFLEPSPKLKRPVRPRVAPLVGRDNALEPRQVARCKGPERVHVGAIAGLELFGDPAQGAIEPQRAQVRRRPVARRAGSERAHREDRPVWRVLSQGVSGHSVSLVDHLLDQRRRQAGLGIHALGACRMGGQHPVELRQEQRDRPAHAEVFGLIDVAFEEIFNFLLPTPALGGIGRALGVETQRTPHRSLRRTPEWALRYPE